MYLIGYSIYLQGIDSTGDDAMAEKGLSLNVLHVQYPTPHRVLYKQP